MEMESEQDRNSIEITTLNSFVAGFIINFVLVIFVWFLSYWLPTISRLALCIGTLLYFGYMGFLTIEIAHCGVPTLFGKRLETYHLNEGTVWLLPSPIMDAVEVNMQERTEHIRVSEIPAVGKIASNIPVGPSESIVEMLVDATLQWRVVDPYRVLDVGESVISDGLEQLVLNTIREEGASKSDVELMGRPATRGELGTAIKEDSKETAGRWGIEVTEVLIKQIIPSDPAVRRAYETYRREERERQGEAVEREFVIESINKIANETGMSVENAAEVFQAERGKMQRQGIRFSSDDAVKSLVSTIIKKLGGE